MLSGTSAYLGFTGATGGAASTQQISNFQFTEGYIAPGNNILPTTTALAISSNASFDLFGSSQKVGDLSGGGVVQNTNSGTTSTLSVGTDNTSQTFSGVIQDGGGYVAFVKVGSGLLTLANANAYSGGTYVGGGTLQLGNVSSLGFSSGALTVNSGVLDLAGFSPQVASLSGSAGVVTNSSSTLSVLDLVSTAAVTTFSGTITDGAYGQVGLQLNGPTLSLTGTNLYNGGTNVASGTLILNGAASLLAGSSLTIGKRPVPGAIFSPPRHSHCSICASARTGYIYTADDRIALRRGGGGPQFS